MPEGQGDTVTSTMLIGDPVARYGGPPLSEADLVRLWEGQRFPPEALVNREGLALRVVYRGRPAGGPGPDFRDAVIAAGGQEWRGDVELHVAASAFRQHGHHRDPAYDNVVLHVVFWDDERLRDSPGLRPLGAHAGPGALGGAAG